MYSALVFGLRYGEKPSQRELSSQGDGYWKRMFPDLDFIKTCNLSYESESASTATLPLSKPSEPNAVQKPNKYGTNSLVPPTGGSVQPAESFSTKAVAAGFLATLGLAILFMVKRKIACFNGCSTSRAVYAPIEVASFEDIEPVR